MNRSLHLRSLTRNYIHSLSDQPYLFVLFFGCALFLYCGLECPGANSASNADLNAAQISPAHPRDAESAARVEQGGHSSPARIAGELPDFEAAARGFPILLDLNGKKLADGDFAQWLENEQLHVAISYDFGSERRIEEKALFRQQPGLVQDEWSWREFKKGELERHFEVDFRSGKATAEKREERDVKRWAEDIKVEPGRTFAGFGFTLAIKTFRARLTKGEKIELQAVGFTPKPRVVPVEISYSGLDQMSMAGRIIVGDHFIIHPKIPWIAKPFVEVHDTRIWLTTPRPAGFLRWEGPLVEPSDPIIRVDLLPGDHSGPAEPAPRRP